MSSVKPTIIAVGVAAALGLTYWGWVTQIKPGQALAKEEAKKIFPGLGADQTSEVLVRRKDSADVLLRRVDGQWRVLQPVQAAADPMAVKTLIDALAAAKNDETIVEKDADLREFGLDVPSGAVTFLPTSKGAKAQALFFGSDNPEGTHAYATVDGKPGVFITVSSLKTAVLKDADALRDKRLWSFPNGDIESVRWEGNALQLDKGGHWMVSGHGRTEPGKVAMVSAWLESLSNLTAIKVPSEDGRGAFGLGSGTRLELTLKGGAKLAAVKGSKAPKGEAGTYAQVGGKGPVFLLSDADAALLAKPAERLMDLDAFDLDQGRVSRYEVNQVGNTLVAVKTNGAWGWGSPQLKPASGKEFDHAAFLLRFAKGQLVRRLDKSQRPQGVVTTVTFYGDDGSVLERATFGSRQRGGQLASSQMKGQVAIVAENLLDGLPKL